MRQRDFIKGVVGSAAIIWPRAARAQQTERVPRVGVLMTTVAADPEGKARIAAFREGLQKLGWTEGQNAQIDIRWGGGDADLDCRFAPR